MARQPERGDMDDAELLAVLADLLAQPKSLTGPIQWVEDGRDLRFTATVEIAEETQERLRLHGRTSASLPDRQVALNLVWLGGPGRALPFERLEWRPIGEHTNRSMVPRPHRHRRITTSHRHPLGLNAGVAIGLLGAMEENLPGAEALDPEPPDWAAFVAVAAAAWQFPDLVNVPPPPWQYDLLSFAGGPGRPGRDR